MKKQRLIEQLRESLAQRAHVFLPSLIVFAICAQCCAQEKSNWHLAPGPLMTRWAANVSPDKIAKEYPRPQMERGDWQSLDGLWNYAIKPKTESEPVEYDGKILVPFAVESALSGVMKPVGADNRLWYRREFSWPVQWRGKRAILHFGAVDWKATVYVNGKEVGTHQGGYTPFSLDITEALKDSGPQTIVVAVWDPTDAEAQPRGKQITHPEGIWYTSVTGIWQTVWLEPVAETSIAAIKIVPDIDAGTVNVSAELRGPADGAVLEVTALDGESEVGSQNGKATAPLSITIPKPKVWTPDTPNLYTLKVTLKQNGKTVDEISSYFAMRKISLAKDQDGVQRLGLNNHPLFQFGPLDQGWWPDGLYTAPSDEALKYDIETIKKLGFNMARKHVKVEPDRWYYWCDKLGLLVWQDMPSGFSTQAKLAKGEKFARTPEESQDFDAELKEMIDTLRNHPSIVMWVPFNEGWGQYDTQRVVEWIKQYDPTRLVDDASGWTDMKVGDVHDMHNYPAPNAPPTEPDRAAVLGEFGGLGLPVTDHMWRAEKNWAYRTYQSPAELENAYLDLVKKLHVLVGSKGLAAGVYTQITDVEGELNGLMTYDRAVLKVDVDWVGAANRRVYTEPPPTPPEIKIIAATSQLKPIEWQYTTSAPANDWFAVDFDDRNWSGGPAGFGTVGTPNTVVRTNWNSADIWIRRTFDVDGAVKFNHPTLLIHHDEDAEIYLNGTWAAKLSGYTTDYELAPLDQAAANLLRPGKNTIAVHCHQTVGGQYIDVGIEDIGPEKK